MKTVAARNDKSQRSGTPKPTVNKMTMYNLNSLKRPPTDARYDERRRTGVALNIRTSAYRRRDVWRVRQQIGIRQNIADFKSLGAEQAQGSFVYTAHAGRSSVNKTTQQIEL